MKIDYLHKLKSSYEEARSFLRDEGVKEPQASHNREPSEIRPACYNEPETLLQKEKILSLFSSR
jgi:hypothetical protein